VQKDEVWNIPDDSSHVQDIHAELMDTVEHLKSSSTHQHQQEQTKHMLA